MSTVPAPGAPRRAAPKRQFRHIRSSLTSYDREPRKVKPKRRQPRRGDRPDLAPTREGDWAHWVDVPLDALDLDAFAPDGTLTDPEHALARWGVA